ncbi:hypothetical protein HPB48_008647 [Haemaphysalis longicornis]|uniref:SOCS box domain-containing protein n=1 Tax=Haemaphysalis longicornis TaxID=44386 RepID=A0A9J6FCI5_HAELO|nr:hypothetical protein HPB48_008647 [Haemaphysalis longicornis]
MDLLVTGMRQGRYVYEPFRKEGAPVELRRTPRSLQELCRRAILTRATLRGLKGSNIPELPSIMRHRLVTLKAKNFFEVDCAPFVDKFGCLIYNRTLTYRVRCSLDGSEYMATYGGACSLMQLAQDFWRWQWVNVMHENIMCIYALALEKRTSNLFAIMDVPEMTLEGLEDVLVLHGLCFPEHFLWKVAQQITSALMYVEERQLSFGRFDRKNIYIIQSKILMDNKLTWKSNVDTSPHLNCVQSVILGDKASIGGRYELLANSPSHVSVKWLGIVLSRLAGSGLVDRTRQPPPPVDLETTVGPSAVPSEMLDGIPVFDGFKPTAPEGSSTYSRDLWDLLSSFHTTKLPPLGAVHAKAVNMMASIAAQSPTQRVSEG